MQNATKQAVLARGNYRCAWCDAKIYTGRKCDEGTVCKLGLCESANMMVSSCVSCARLFATYWPAGVEWSIGAAVNKLGPDNVVESAPFVDYLFAATGDLRCFDNALARIEAQRNQELDLIAGQRLARKVVA